MNVPINYLAVVIATIVSMGIGAIWYSPLLFGKVWMKLIGLSGKDMTGQKQNMGKTYGLTALATLVMAFVLAHNIVFGEMATGTSGLSAGLQGGFWVWLGFFAAGGALRYLFPAKPLKLYLIDMGHHLVVLLVMGAILGVWK